MTTTAPTSTTAAIKTYDHTVGDYTFHVNEAGDPSLPTIVWLHGSGPGISALSNWEHLITALAPRYHSIAPDMIGYGESSHPDPAPIGTAASNRVRGEALVALLDDLGIEKSHIVGNSMGGMITLDMLGYAADRFDKVILMGTGGGPTPPTEALVEMVFFYEDPTEDTMRKLMKNFVYDTATLGGKLDEIAADRVSRALWPDVKRSHLATFDLSNGAMTFSPEYLAAIDKEVLLVHGREDKMIPLESSVFFAENLPNAQLHVFPHGGHWIQIEQAERFKIYLEAFLTEGAVR